MKKKEGGHEELNDVCTHKDRRKKEYAKPELTVHENLRTVTGGISGK